MYRLIVVASALFISGCSGTAQVGDSLRASAGSTAAEIDGALCGEQPIRLQVANSTDHKLSGSYTIRKGDVECIIVLELENAATAAQQASNDAVARALEAVLSRIPLVP
jgi:hypothetical protein